MISIIIPVYNEEKIILEKYDFLIAYLKENNILDYELIYGNDGSIDDSYEIINQIIKKNKKVKQVVWKKNIGKGYTLKKLYAKAKGNIIIQFDADFSVKPNIIKDFLCELKNGEELVIASRYIGGNSMIPKKRIILSRLYNFIIKNLFNLDISDTQSGFIAFKTFILSDINLLTSGFHFPVEFLYKVKKRGYKIKEIKCNYIHRTIGSKFHILKDGILTLFATIKLYYNIVYRKK